MTADSPKRLLRLTPDQGLGAAPGGNAWMSASAGTGKTQVLTARVLRLLLAGVDPHAILAITFTKAGASEMARRIREVLARWVQLPDKELRHELFAVHLPNHDDAAMLGRARTLFAKVIDAPGNGLAIQTIHSFCQSLLASFPEEARLAPGFRALDEREIATVRREVLGDLIEGAARTGDLPFLARLETLSLAIGEKATTEYLYRCAAAAEALDALPGAIAPWLRRSFDLPGGDPQNWAQTQCADDCIDCAALHAILEANRAWSTPTGDKHADAIGLWLASDAEARAARLSSCLETIITQKGEIRSEYRPPKKLAYVGDLAQRVADTLGAISATALQMAASDRVADALEAGRTFARAFALRKRREGLVDFDDLIARTVQLLGDEGRSAWIRFKLDARIDHILVDEAQDTNQHQWDIIEALTEEYFAGEGAKGDALRTMFVVGDFKQAIYGFQGTSPLNFARARQHFAVRGDFADRRFADIGIDTNFRSSPPVLRVVDGVIGRLGPRALGLDGADVRHSAHATQAFGRVTLWPLEPQSVGDDGGDQDGETGEEGWIDSATRRVADKIGRTVRAWIEHGIDGEPVKASDVMVLVRKRGDIASLIVSRLQGHGVAVAGVDRLRLQTPIAVQDLLAAARFSLQPLDDLNLACLLVSPLLGWSHDELIAHGWRQDENGKSPPLWPHLRAAVDAGSLDPVRIEPLYALLKMAGFVTPYRFFETLLSGPLQGRARLLARLGNAALDPVEELVSQALAFETREGASLHRFLQWFDSGTIDIKREIDTAADEVRVMTVHGAKGLQAKIVILADAGGDPTKRRNTGLGWDAGDGKLPLIAVPKGERAPALQAMAEADDASELEEHWRLLYVAMTRAERMLFVAGALPASEEMPDLCWYGAIEPVLAGIGGEWQASGDHWQRSLSYTVAGREPRGTEPAMPPPPDPAIPDWARADAPVEPRPLRPLAPSAVGEEDALSVPQSPPGPPAAIAAQRGTLMHSLFERLPAVAPGARQSAGERWLDRAAPAFDPAARAAMLDEVLAILADPAHAALFGPGSLAEVPFSALVDGRVVAGSIDRLLVEDRSVSVIDFKTGLSVPDRAEDVAPGYLRQMAAYVAALGVIFPDHSIVAALLFTGGPRLIELPPALIAAHKPDFADTKAILAAAT